MKKKSRAMPTVETPQSSGSRTYGSYVPSPEAASSAAIFRCSVMYQGTKTRAPWTAFTSQNIGVEKTP